ncbi:MAG: pyridoxamine 5'-phosphate oxidase [Myxococcales bacterium]|nr:pyridoxamine 5'-phosphate oxidase [Myxococcales bacterium]
MSPALATLDPIARFIDALGRAAVTEPDVPDAAVLATVNEDGQPSARVVLIRGVDPRGFRFFTNYQSQKGRELSHNPRAALAVHWKSLKEQVRIEGTTTRLSASESDAYFASRPHESQLAAIASHQSAELESKAQLEQRFAELVTQYGAQRAERPEGWGGYLLVPTRIEFWREGPHRLHDRERFDRDALGQWTMRILYP